MGRFNYDPTKVAEAIDELTRSKTFLSDTKSELKSALDTIKSARGIGSVSIPTDFLEYPSSAIELIDNQITKINSAVTKIEEYNNSNFIDKAFSTVFMTVANVAEGIGTACEQIVDGAASLLGLAVGIFSKDAQDSIADFIKKDWVGDSFDNAYSNGWLSSIENHSFFSSQSTGAKIFKGVGTAVGYIGAAALTGGIGAAAGGGSFAAGAAAAGSNLGLQAGMAFAGGLGSGTSSGLQNGDSYGKAFVHGVKDGAVQAGTVVVVTKGVEKLGGLVSKAASNSADDLTKGLTSVADDIKGGADFVDDLSQIGENTATNLGDDALRNSNLGSMDQVTGKMRGPASQNGAPTANNSALADMADDEFAALSNSVDDTLRNSNLGSMDQAGGTMRGPASQNGAPTANNSAFADMADNEFTALSNSVDDGLRNSNLGSMDQASGKMRGPASQNGAPTAKNSAFADMSDDGFNALSNSADDALRNSKLGSMDQAGGTMRGPASQNGAPTANNSALADMADELSSKSITSNGPRRKINIERAQRLLENSDNPEVSKLASNYLDDTTKGVSKAADNLKGTTDIVDDAIKNSKVRSVDPSTGKVNASASQNGAPTAKTSAFADMTDDEFKALTTRVDDGLRNSKLGSMDQATGTMRGPASQNGAPTAKNSAFADMTDDGFNALSNSVDDGLRNSKLGSMDQAGGRMRGPASQNGAPTAKNSAFADMTNDEFTALSNSVDDTLRNSKLGSMDQATGKMRGPASQNGAPTAETSAFANMTSKVGVAPTVVENTKKFVSPAYVISHDKPKAPEPTIDVKPMAVDIKPVVSPAKIEEPPVLPPTKIEQPHAEDNSYFVRSNSNENSHINMRSIASFDGTRTPSKNSNIIASLEPNTKVELTGEKFHQEGSSDYWVEAKYKDSSGKEVTGWISDRYVRKDNGDDSSSSIFDNDHDII